VFSFQALYAGVAPAKARAVYGCISHMDTGMGVHYPVDSASGSGMGAVPGLLADAFVKAGGELRLSTRVAGVRMAGDVVGAVLADDGEAIACGGLLPTVDLPIVERWLAEAGAAPRRRLVTPRFSPSAMVAHGAVPVDVAEAWPRRHHLISFGAKWRETFDEISATRGGRLMSDPSLLVTRPAVTAPDRVVTDADGRDWEPVSVLAPTP